MVRHMQSAVVLLCFAIQSLAACSSEAPPLASPDVAPSGQLDLQFGGRDEDLCALLRLPPSMTGSPVTFTIAPAATVADAPTVTAVVDGSGQARASWTLQPGVEGEWTVIADIETTSGRASARAVASTGLTANPRQNESPPCPV